MAETVVNSGEDDSVLTDDKRTHRVRGKRLFPHLSNRTSTVQVKNTVRRYMPHGNGEDYEIYQPCSRFQETRTLCELESHELVQLKTNIQSRATTNFGAEEHKDNGDSEEINVTAARLSPLHKPEVEAVPYVPKYLAVRRNHIPLSTPGDKSYQSVEYSSDFFKHGATVPLVNFGKSVKRSRTTTEALPALLSAKQKTFVELETQRLKNMEIDEVLNLEQWRPATPLVSPGFSGPITLAAVTNRRRKV